MTARTFRMPHDRQQLRDFWSRQPKDFRCVVRIEPYKKLRSLPANNFYWGCVVEPLAAACGYTRREMHDEICGDLYGWVERQFRGHKRLVPRRTSTTPDTLDTMDFAELIAHGQKIAAELCVPLPDQESAA